MRIFVAATITILFAVAETVHFGWNPYPKSDAELICDGITALLAISVIILSQSDERTPKYPKEKGRE